MSDSIVVPTSTAPVPSPPFVPDPNQVNEGVQFLAAITLVGVITVVYEVARHRRGVARRDQYMDACTSFIFMMLLATGFIHRSFGGSDEPSIMITAGAGMQLFAFALLYLAPRGATEQTSEQRRAPAEFGCLMVFALAARFWCTMKYDGYLPSDQTGDGCIQTLEALAMQICVVGLARQAVTQREAFRALGGLLFSMTAAQVCYGTLDSRPWVDRTYAATQYAELIAWIYMADFAREVRKNGQVNGMYVLPAFVNAACRAFFWVSAYPEMLPEQPIRLMAAFPVVLIAVQIFMGGVILSIGMLKDLKEPLLLRMVELTGFDADV